MTERQKKESKNRRLQRAKNQKEKERSNLIQNKITSTWRRLPKHEKIHLLAEEEKKKKTKTKGGKGKPVEEMEKGIRRAEKKSHNQPQEQTGRVVAEDRKHTGKNAERSGRQGKCQRRI